MKKKKNLRIKKPLKRGLKKNSQFNFNRLVVIFLIFLIGSLGYVFLIHSQKNYDPALEKNLDMNTLPSDVRRQLPKEPLLITYRVPVLIYHYVEYVRDEKDTIRQSLNINPFTFEQQIIVLKKAEYTFITAGELGRVLDGEMNMPKKPILLTFDDGHWDLYTDVLPILKKYNVKATAYIVPGLLGGSDFLKPDQVQQIVDSGLIEIGAHTVHHSYLKKLDLKTVKKEVEVSKAMLEDEFHIPVVSFAYPYGAFDAQAIEIVKNAGFKTAVSTLPGIEVNQADRYFIYRIRPGGRVGDTLINYLQDYQQTPQTTTTAAKD
jgi:peptidoglycan/xylan/chitin deacetylase (PgdA/CDA1 family)